MDCGYSSQLAGEILERFHAKGWNLYDSSCLVELGAEGTVLTGNVTTLDVGGKYVLLPKVEDPTDFAQVLGALEKLAQRLGRNMPTIQLGFESYPLTGITLRRNYVKVHTPEGTILPYSFFMGALDSIVQAV